MVTSPQQNQLQWSILFSSSSTSPPPPPPWGEFSKCLNVFLNNFYKLQISFVSKLVSAKSKVKRHQIKIHFHFFFLMLIKVYFSLPAIILRLFNSWICCWWILLYHTTRHNGNEGVVHSRRKTLAEVQQLQWQLILEEPKNNNNNKSKNPTWVFGGEGDNICEMFRLEIGGYRLSEGTCIISGWLQNGNVHSFLKSYIKAVYCNFTVQNHYNHLLTTPQQDKHCNMESWCITHAIIITAILAL